MKEKLCEIFRCQNFDGQQMFFFVCQNDEKCFSSGILSDTEKKFHLFKCPNDINNRNADFFLSSNTN